MLFRSGGAIRPVISTSPSRLFEFAGAAPGPIRQNLLLEEFTKEVGINLRPLSILQSDDPASNNAAGGLLRRWPQPGLGVQKHHGYAFQWFALSALLAGLFVWFQLIRPRLKRSAVEQNN